jgi:arsenate reductase (thioredoxin)
MHRLHNHVGGSGLADRDGVEEAFGMLKRRIQLLLSLPLANLGDEAMRERLQAIGREADVR